MAGTMRTGNWKPLMTLILLFSPCLPSSSIPTIDRNTRSHWFSLIPSRGTISLENPGSGYPDYQVELDRTGVSRFNHHREQPDSVSRWPSLVSPSNESTVIPAATTNEALEASVSNDLSRLNLASDNLLSRRLGCRGASQPPTREPLAPAISILLRRNCYAHLIS